MNQPADRSPVAARDPGDFTDRLAGPPQRLNVEGLFILTNPGYPLRPRIAATGSTLPSLGGLSIFKPWTG